MPFQHIRWWGKRIPMCQKKIDPLLTPYTEINSKEARYKSLSEISDLGMSKELLDTIPKAQIHKRKKN